ncbi:hypothetical protein OSTOST_00117 [Ostertagia ostertagi]
MFEVALKNMDVDPSKRNDTGSPFDPKVIGRAHGLLRPYGLTGQYWEKIGEILIDVVLGQEAVRDLPGAGQAWVIFTACLVDQLRTGFEESRGPCQEFPKREVVLHYATKHLYETEEPDSLIVTDSSLLPTVTSTNWKDRDDLSEPNCSHKQVVEEAHNCHIPREQNMIQQGKRRLSKRAQSLHHPNDITLRKWLDRKLSLEESAHGAVQSNQPKEFCSNKDENVRSKSTNSAAQEATTSSSRRRHSNVDASLPEICVNKS